MFLTTNEIRRRALEFSHSWKDEYSEKAESHTFWNEFFNVFGVERRRVAQFEALVKKLGATRGYIDLFWKGKLVVEHKSKGKDLESAFIQAIEYLDGIKDHELPRYVIVSDFENLKLYDLESDEQTQMKLCDLHNNIHLFSFISGHEKQRYKEEAPLNIKAAELMGKLHDVLTENGYEGHCLELLLVRIMFCLFSEKTGIFEKDDFFFYIDTKTKNDGSDLGIHLVQIFEVLNTPQDKRQRSLDDDLSKLPYVNGKLFEERIQIPAFDKNARDILLETCYFNWGEISPAIFGSMFQSVMNLEKRRNIGAHYTSEKNIMKVIRTLFLDELTKEFEKSKYSVNKLNDLKEKVKDLKLFDPACGCGNFLVVSYRELRNMELLIHKRLIHLQNKNKKGKPQFLDVSIFQGIDVDSMYGIEIEEFPARIAEVALWLMDHQMNVKLSEEFGFYYARLPLKKSPNIYVKNALTTDWDTIIPKSEINFILGNPPFAGKKRRNRQQTNDMKLVWDDLKNYKVLDYVTSWYKKALDFIHGTSITVSFVSTNSITQGEQAGVLWDYLFKNSVKIHFAHRTFKWSNEAKNVAGVYVVIIGFGIYDVKNKYLFDYESPSSEPVKIKVKNINGYLIDQEDFVIQNRNTSICESPPISFGSMPNDGGNLLLSDEEKKDFLTIEPKAKKFIKPLLTAREYLHNKKRWCLWLIDANPSDLKSLQTVQKRIKRVKEHRLKSKRKSTYKLAETPYLFGEIRQPTKGNYILIPRHSSERRQYIPMSLYSKKFIAGDSCCIIQNAKKYHLGILTSLMHMIWVKQICGRIKSDYRYSNKLVYNNFPWPEKVNEKKMNNVVKCMDNIISIRKEYSGEELANLYNPLIMPKKLRNAHNKLDRSVDNCYRNKTFKSELERIEFLFNLYKRYLNNAKE